VPGPIERAERPYAGGGRPGERLDAEVMAVMRSWDGGGGWGWGAWLMMTVLLVVFWGAVAWVIVTLIRHGDSTPRSTHDGGASDPLRILDQRYARGEIDDEEYRRRRNTLLGSE